MTFVMITVKKWNWKKLNSQRVHKGWKPSFEFIRLTCDAASMMETLEWSVSLFVGCVVPGWLLSEFMLYWFLARSASCHILYLCKGEFCKWGWDKAEIWWIGCPNRVRNVTYLILKEKCIKVKNVGVYHFLITLHDFLMERQYSIMR